MTMIGKKEVIKELGNYIQKDGGLYSLGAYLAWSVGDDGAVLDGTFSAEELEAIAWWMKNTATDNPALQVNQGGK